MDRAAHGHRRPLRPQPQSRLGHLLAQYVHALPTLVFLSLSTDSFNRFLFLFVLFVLLFVFFAVGAYIRRVFVNARRLFQTPVKNMPPGFLEVTFLFLLNFHLKKSIPLKSTVAFFFGGGGFPTISLLDSALARSDFKCAPFLVI